MGGGTRDTHRARRRPTHSPSGWRGQWAWRAGWTFLYAVAFWGGFALFSLFSQEARSEWGWVPVVFPLALALFGGVWLCAWWWVAGAPLGIILATAAYLGYYLTTRDPTVDDGGAGGFLFAFGVTFAGVVSVLAAAGVLCGRIARRYLGRSRASSRTSNPTELPLLDAAAVETSPDEPTGRIR